MEHSDSIGQLAAAKAKAQAGFKPIGKDQSADVYSQRTGKSYSYSYADLAQCLAAVVPALSENGLALFQPVRVVDATVIATTLLVHESNEWIKEDFMVPVADITDARSIGSAATYAKRYGLVGLLGIASSEEDDDGEQARGGQHEMKDKEKKGPCPICGVVGSIIKGKAEYGGGWLCWKKEGGCGAKWPDGPYPTKEPDEIPMPKERFVKDEQTLAMERRLEEANKRLPVEGKPAGEATGTPDPRSSQPRAGSSKLRSVKKDSAPSEVGQASTEAPAEQAPGMGGGDAPQPVTFGDARPPAVVNFMYEGTEYTTFGMTEKQFAQSWDLVKEMDEKVARGAGRVLLAEVLGVPVKKASRTDCTEAEARTWIEKMQKALEGR